MRIEDIKDIDFLRQMAQVLEHENKKLVQEVVKLKQRMIELEQGDPEQITLRIAELERQLAARNKQIFGDSSEKRSRGNTGSLVSWRFPRAISSLSSRRCRRWASWVCRIQLR